MKRIILLAALISLIGCGQNKNSAETKQGTDSNKIASYRYVWTSPIDTAFRNYEIYSMNTDGSDKRNLTNNPALDWAYSTYDDKIYFVSDRNAAPREYYLYEMNSLGEGLRKIYDQPLPDSFVSTIDGNQFLIARGKKLDREIFLIDREGNELKRLTNNEFVDTDPAFSPDGSLIAFRSSRGEDPTSKEEIWVMNADGSDPRQLSFFPPEIKLPNTGVYKAGPPIWSPDGNWICFISYRENRYNIYKVKPDGSDFGRLTTYNDNEGYFQFSDDGKLIIFDGELDEGGVVDINVYLMNADGSNVRIIADGPRLEQNPLFVKTYSVSK